MRFFYTILVSGLLIFQEVPLDQHPPATVDDVPYRGVATMMNELGLPSFRFPTQYKPNYSVQYQLEDEPMRAGASHDAPDLAAQPVAEVKATPTPLSKVTTVDTALATYGQQSILPISGYAMFYNPNVMQQVVNNRLAMGHISTCPECIGNVALLRAGDLDRRVWLEWADGTIEGPFLVADTAASHHVAQLLARGWVVDVDNRTAVRRGMAGPVMVTVWGAPPSGQAENQTHEPPFMPLYSTMPTAAPASLPTALPTPISTALATPVAAQVPTQTPMDVATAVATRSPTQVATPYTELVVKPAALTVDSATPAAVAVVQSGFPTDTPMPTITPLPVIAATATPMPTATLPPTVVRTLEPSPTATALPTLVPTFTATASPTLTRLPSPAPTLLPSASTAITATITSITSRGFPTDTPVPTVTPLPYITSTPTPLPN